MSGGCAVVRRQWSACMMAPQQVVARHEASVIGDAQNSQREGLVRKSGRVLNRKDALKGGVPPSPQDRQ